MKWKRKDKSNQDSGPCKIISTLIEETEKFELERSEIGRNVNWTSKEKIILNKDIFWEFSQSVRINQASSFLGARGAWTYNAERL